jgi:hypothetical protein
LSSSQITLNWADNSNNETGFKIERSPDGTTATFLQIGVVGANVTTYSDAGLLGGTTYHYRVRSNNAGGDSPFSNVARATTPFVAGVQGPANLRAVVGSTKKEIELAWTDNNTNEIGFIIERSENGGFFWPIGAAFANVTTYRDTRFKSRTTYSYRVRSVSWRGLSGYSNTATVTTPQNSGNAGLLNPLPVVGSPVQTALTRSSASDPPARPKRGGSFMLTRSARADWKQTWDPMCQKVFHLELNSHRAGTVL